MIFVFVQIFMYVWKKLSADEKTSAVLRLLHTANLRPNENLVLKVGSAFEAFKNHSRLHRCVSRQIENSWRLLFASLHANF